MDIIQNKIGDERSFKTFFELAKSNSSGTNSLANRIEGIMILFKESVSLPTFKYQHFPKEYILAVAGHVKDSITTVVGDFFTSILPPIKEIPSINRSNRINRYLEVSNKLITLHYIQKELNKLIQLANSAANENLPLEDEEVLFISEEPSEQGIPINLHQKRSFIELYWELLKQEQEILTELLSGLSQSPPTTEREFILKKEINEAFLLCIKQIGCFTGDPILQNEGLTLILLEDASSFQEYMSHLLGTCSKLVNEESQIVQKKDWLSFSTLMDEPTRKQTALEIAKLQLSLSKAKLFLSSKRISMMNLLFGNTHETSHTKSQQISAEHALTFNPQEKEALHAIQQVFTNSKKELTDEIFARKVLKRQLHRDFGRNQFPLNTPSTLSKLIQDLKVNHLLDFNHFIQPIDNIIEPMIEEMEVILLSPIGFLLLEPDTKPVSGNLLKKATHEIRRKASQIFGTNFSHSVALIKHQIRELKLKIEAEYSHLQQQSSIRDGTPTRELLARGEESQKTAEITKLEKDLNLLNLSLNQILMTRLIDVLGTTQNQLKKSKEAIAQDEKSIPQIQKLILACDRLIESENQIPGSRSNREIVDALEAEFPREVIKELRLALNEPELKDLDNKAALSAIKERAQNKIKTLEMTVEIKKEENKHTEEKIKLLQNSYSKMIAHYEAQYFAQPAVTLKEAMIESTKKVLLKVLSLNFINNDLMHPREIRAKKHYANLGYCMQEEVMNFLEKLSVKTVDGEVWQSVIQKEIQLFLTWAEEHPYSAANMAADMIQVFTTVQSTIMGTSALAASVTQFYSVLKTKIFIHILLNAAGYNEFEPLDKKTLHFRALADLAKSAPILSAALRGGAAAISANGPKEMIIEGIKGAMGQAAINSLIQSYMNQISLAHAESSLRVFRLAFNILRGDPYVDSVIEQRNLEFSRFVVEAKEAFIRPGGFVKKVGQVVSHWWKSVKHSDSNEFWIRIGAQLADTGHRCHSCHDHRIFNVPTRSYYCLLYIWWYNRI